MFEYFRWKRKAFRAMRNNQTRPCLYCTDPIVPDDLVGQHREYGEAPCMFHAGTHYSINSQSALCKPESEAVGRWDGYNIRDDNGNIIPTLHFK